VLDQTIPETPRDMDNAIEDEEEEKEPNLVCSGDIMDPIDPRAGELQYPFSTDFFTQGEGSTNN